MQLSRADQETLLSSSCLRLLLLAMAETNLHVATTIVTADNNAATSMGEEKQEIDKIPCRDRETWKAPTTQFVSCIQNFIRKCQLLGVTSEEYFQMKLITLFHSGIGSVDCTRVANRINSSARQDLQDLVSHLNPSEKLRYSSLLLSLHTLFGVHCGMLRSLFCQHLDKTGGVKGFVNEALNTT